MQSAAINEGNADEKDEKETHLRELLDDELKVISGGDDDDDDDDDDTASNGNGGGYSTEA